MTETVAKHIKAIEDEIKTLRGWLDYLERDITNKQGVISAVLTASINESCMKLIYNAGMANGAVIAKYDNEKSK